MHNCLVVSVTDAVLHIVSFDYIQSMGKLDSGDQYIQDLDFTCTGKRLCLII